MNLLHISTKTQGVAICGMPFPNVQIHKQHLFKHEVLQHHSSLGSLCPECFANPKALEYLYHPSERFRGAKIPDLSLSQKNMKRFEESLTKEFD